MILYENYRRENDRKVLIMEINNMVRVRSYMVYAIIASKVL